MKIIVIDDEKAMHLIMRKLLMKVPSVTFLGAFFCTDSAIDFIKKHEVDLVFVDINMPKENGIAFAHKMDNLFPHIQLAFVTSHKDYALEAFELSALDYLLKPVSVERLQKAIDKAIALKQFSYSSPRLAEENELSVFTLGTFEIRTSKVGHVKFISKKSKEVFAYLLMHMGRKVSRIKLISDVFPDMPQKNAELYLNTAMYQLRKSLDVHGYRHIVLSDHDGYELVASTKNVDVYQLKQFFSNYPSIENFDVQAFLSVDSLYQGELFEESGYLWAVNDAVHFEQLFTKYAMEASKTLIQNSETDKGIDLLTKLMHLNKWNEEIIIQLLQAYAITGNHHNLEETFVAYKNNLAIDLGIDVSRKVTELFNHLKQTI